jgi:hypothetical protein
VAPALASVPHAVRDVPDAAAEITIEYVWLAIWLGELESVTFSAKEEVPLAAGDPLIVPVDAPRVNPVGNVPLLTDQV